MLNKEGYKMKILKNRVKESIKEVSQEKNINFQTYIQMVEEKAYELFERRGCQHGCHLGDWFEAEKLVEDKVVANVAYKR